jgi:phospholipid/cholesterol/gamma-HCH transport system substrate-binding protein
VNRRIVVNLAAVAAVFLLLASWAVRNVLHLDLVGAPRAVVAEFERSPGLRRDVEVAYLGTRVGTVGSVSLRPGRVDVTLRIDHDVDLPAELSAAVRRKSAVGEPYVDLAPATPGAGGELADGARIPLERTSTPLDYADLFASLADLVAAVPPDDLRTLVHELAVGLEGNGESIRTIVTGLADTTSAFAERGDVLDRLAADLTRLTGTLAEHRGSLASGVDDLAALAGTLAESRADVEALLAQDPTFTGRLADLLERSSGDLGCLTDALGTVGGAVTTAEHLRDIADLLQLGPQMLAVFRSVVDEEADGPYIRTIEPVNLGLPGAAGAPVPQYESAAAPPPVPGLPACAASAAPPRSGPGDASPGAGDGAGEVGAPPSDAATAAPEPVAGPADRAQGPPPEDGGLGLWPVVLAAAFVGPLTLAWLAARRDRRTTPGRNP